MTKTKRDNPMPKGSMPLSVAQAWIDNQPNPDRYRMDVYALGNKMVAAIVDEHRFLGGLS